jgi:cation diffusion facilitator CzcD-associated flavoprotein CzcO
MCEDTHITRVAIIGAGASGIAQLKQLLDAFARPEVTMKLEVVLYESRDQVGGVW